MKNQAPSKRKKTIFTEEHRCLVARLKAARLKANLDQSEVATKLGRTQSYISKLEAGQRRIDLVQIKELAKLYNRSLNYFLSK